MNNRIKSTLIMALGVLHSFITTKYFGGHVFPQTAEECISDGICVLIICFGLSKWE